MNVFIKESPIHGRGVFANEIIEEGEWQFVYGEVRVVLPGDRFEKYGTEWGDDQTFVPYAPWCCCNHSSDPNCEISEYDGHGDVLIIGALRDIPPGEEVTLDYGPSADWVEWKEVPGYKGIYEVSNEGVVRSLQRKNSRGHLLNSIILKSTTSKNLYPYVTLTKNAKQRKFYVHQLVMLSFEGPPPPDMEVCHEDGNRSNTRRKNLRYGTRKNNREDAIKHGTTNARPVL